MSFIKQGVSSFIRNFSTIINRGGKRSQLVKRHILYSLLLKGLSIIVGLLFVPLLINYLDAERYGVWITLTSIVGWFTFFDAGLGNGLRNKLTEALAKEDYVLAKQYVSTTYALVTVIFISVLIIFYIVNLFLDWRVILNTQSVPIKELNLLVLVVFTFFFLKFIFNLIGIVLMSDQRPSLNNAFGPIGNIISIILIYILSITTKGAFVIMGAILSIVPVIILSIATYFLFAGRYKSLKPSLKYIRWEHSRILLGLGIKFFVIQITSIVLFASSSLIITQILGPSYVTIYNVAFKYFQIPIMIYSIIMIPIWSAVTDAYVKKDYKWLQSTLRKLNIVSFVFIIGIIIMLLGSNFIYGIWLNNKVFVPYYVSISMAVYASIVVFLSPYSQFINGFGTLFLNTRLVIVALTLYIPLAIFLTKSELGIAGVVVATCIVNGLGMPIQIIQTRRLIKQKAHGVWGR